MKAFNIVKLSLLAQLGIFSVMVLALRPAFAQDSLPVAWRKPTLAETNGDWRKKSPRRFLVAEGDFDSDGKQDIAELLVDVPGKHFGLFVKLAAAQDWVMLDGGQGEVRDLANFGIDLVKPGKYKTACGKGYGDYACAHGEPQLLKLSGSAIDFFYNESSDFIFYWDAKTKKFVKIQMSD